MRTTEYVPPHYPNYPQAKLLLQEGVRDPITRSLTIISIVEGFGARIRDLPLPDFRAEVVEDVGGTALAHLANGLFEAHARDEAGFRDQGGHKQMWEAARDLGLAKPEIPDDVPGFLDDAELEESDVDNDGVGDIAELRAGADPNVPGDQSICGPQYGCGARVEPRGSIDLSSAFAALLTALLLFGWSRRR